MTPAVAKRSGVAVVLKIRKLFQSAAASAKSMAAQTAAACAALHCSALARGLSG
jgi:hypothetical protein